MLMPVAGRAGSVLPPATPEHPEMFSSYRWDGAKLTPGHQCLNSNGCAMENAT